MYSARGGGYVCVWEGGGWGGGELCQDHIPKKLKKKILLTCCVQYLTSAFSCHTCH